MTTESSTLASFLRAFFKLLWSHPASAALTVSAGMIALIVCALVLYTYFEPRSDFSQQLNTVSTAIGEKIDHVSCEVQWNRYQAQYRIYVQSARALNRQIMTMKQYLTKADGSATPQEHAYYDSLVSQLNDTKNDENNLRVPRCTYPFSW